MTDSLLPNH